MNEELKKMDEPEILNFIRERLTISEYSSEFANIGIFSREPIRLRFDMSGYESKAGTNTVGNQAILNRFADLGIYDYTNYLFLDFFKGSGTIYWQYSSGNEVNETKDVIGLSTSEIIHEILKITILSGNGKRRRI